MAAWQSGSGAGASFVVGMLLMLAGTLILLFADGLPSLVVARLFQGAGAALSVGAVSATFTESYQGRIAPGQALAVVTALALSVGPVVTAIAFDLGGWSFYDGCRCQDTMKGHSGG